MKEKWKFWRWTGFVWKKLWTSFVYSTSWRAGSFLLEADTPRTPRNKLIATLHSAYSVGKNIRWLFIETLANAASSCGLWRARGGRQCTASLPTGGSSCELWWHEPAAGASIHSPPKHQTTPSPPANPLMPTPNWPRLSENKQSSLLHKSASELRVLSDVHYLCTDKDVWSPGTFNMLLS